MRNIEAIQVSEEAVNGSNVRVVMKTSVFEVVKNNFLSVLETDPNIEKVETKRTVKAKSANGGSAEVEYIFDIILNKDGVKHEIVFTCYNTTNHFQIQKRGKHEKFQSLGGKFVPKYFIDYYLVPFAEKVVKDNPNIDDYFIPLLEEEMKRMNLLNKPTKNTAKKSKTKVSNSKENV